MPFVARQRELAYLDRHLGRALSGDGHVVFVTGQAGSGKTALIQEFALRAMATERDIIVANGRCTALSALGDPLLPFREIVRMLTGDIEVSARRWRYYAGARPAALGHCACGGAGHRRGGARPHRPLRVRRHLVAPP